MSLPSTGPCFKDKFGPQHEPCEGTGWYLKLIPRCKRKWNDMARLDVGPLGVSRTSGLIPGAGVHLA